MAKNVTLRSTSAGQRLPGKVKLIYIDPPFDSGADFMAKSVLCKLQLRF